MISRIAIVLLSLLFLMSGAVPAQTLDVESAKSFVQKVYADYANTDWQHQYQRQVRFYTTGLHRLILADRKDHPGEVGELDFDPVCGCQDAGDPGELKVQSITFSASGQTRLKAQVQYLIVKGPPHTITLLLLNTQAGWRIDDIMTKDMPSLRALLGSKKVHGLQRSQ